MTENLSDDERQKRLLMRTSAIIESSTARHLRKIEQAVEGLAVPYVLPGAEHPTEKRLCTMDELYVVRIGLAGLFKTLTPVDARCGDVPNQLADRFRTLAARLTEMAMAVEQVAPEEYRHEPRAYVVRSKVTNELVGSRMTLIGAESLAESYEAITNARPSVSTAPIELWPEAQAEYDAVLRWSKVDGE